ncbi:fungal-specific transcription factor domain-containing protein [Lophiotrema nucula]|uniref:Fungal-specific transcription factor domain-containing protein n=1 Tax=Lophiotrema nucula TaxID=690887 RepID=A0A6A5Z4W1_9PLEO|nr:fungal-specific transcription factor domain-containing protein [Lophiotrema nucula]
MLKKAIHNCWTCKGATFLHDTEVGRLADQRAERKVGCDRALPTCQNCKRSNRTCNGYGLKLAWPDKIDGRRKQKKYHADPGTSSKHYITQNGSFAFLNTTFDDLSGEKINFQDLIKVEKGLKNLSLGPTPAISIAPGFESKDGYLLSYYDQVLARMITTIDDNSNGFRLDLIPMALASSDAASTSLLQATLALSSFHLGRAEDALRYKVKAIKSLSDSFQNGTASQLSQFASCMMLCVYSVFDASDTTWHLHLQGAKSITAALSQYERTMPSFDFFSSWFNYHDTFSSYSHSANVASLNSVVNIELPEDDSKTRKIVGSLGCSPELLSLISCTNQLRAFKDSNSWSPGQPPREVIELATRMRERLKNLNQEIHISFGETIGTIDHRRITLTAEFYRLGAMLYLYQVAPRATIPENGVQGLVNEGFAILDQMEICTSPWPLFMLACNVTSDVDRLKTLQILDAMDQKRRIGNYQIIRGLIQAVWKQQDLTADEKVPTRVDWRTLIDSDSSVPSFI